MRYIVVDPAVEINGELYKRGDVLDASQFRPRDLAAERERTADEPEPLDELHSLLSTGHIVPVAE